MGKNIITDDKFNSNLSIDVIPFLFVRITTYQKNVL